MRRTRGFTLIEVLIGLAVISVLMAVLYGAFHLLFGNKSRSNLTNLTRRSFLQKDARSGLRRMVYRLREGVQILEPAPGQTRSELVFRDITNQDVRVRLVPEEKVVVSEHKENETWIREEQPETVETTTGTLPVGWPVKILNCASLHFTALAPDAVTVQARLELDGQASSILTVIKLRNSGLAE